MNTGATCVSSSKAEQHVLLLAENSCRIKTRKRGGKQSGSETRGCRRGKGRRLFALNISAPNPCRNPAGHGRSAGTDTLVSPKKIESELEGAADDRGTSQRKEKREVGVYLFVCVSALWKC